MAHFIAIDEHGIAIQGYGETSEDAIHMALCDAGPLFDHEGNILSYEAAAQKFVVYPATPALIDDVKVYGGGCIFDIVDGTAQLPVDDEEE